MLCVGRVDSDSHLENSIKSSKDEEEEKGGGREK